MRSTALQLYLLIICFDTNFCANEDGASVRKIANDEKRKARITDSTRRLQIRLNEVTSELSKKHQQLVAERDANLEGIFQPERDRINSEISKTTDSITTIKEVLELNSNKEQTPIIVASNEHLQRDLLFKEEKLEDLKQRQNELEKRAQTQANRHQNRIKFLERELSRLEGVKAAISAQLEELDGALDSS